MAIAISVGLYFIDTYEALLSASALAANGLLRYVVGATVPLSTLTMYEKLGVGWATSLLGFVAAAMFPISWLAYYWGHELRIRSRYETNKI